MSARTTIVTVVLAVIGVLVTMVMYRGGTGQVSEQGGLLPATRGLSVDAVDRITLRRDGIVMIFERHGDRWQQVEPFAFPMDAYSMRRLAVEAAELEVVSRLDPADAPGAPDAPEDLGLDPPRAVLTCMWPGGQSTLQLGRQGVGGRTYVRCGGDDTVWVVRGALPERVLEMDPREWRDRTIFAGLDAAACATRIEIDNGDQRIVLEREPGAARWTMAEPFHTRLDEAARTALIAAIDRAKSDGFILDQPVNLDQFGLETPAATLTIECQPTAGSPAEVTEHRLRIGQRTGVGVNDHFAIVDGRPAVIRLDEPVLRAFFPSSLSLIDPTGTGVQAADVMSIAVRADGREFRLRRDLDSWTAPDFETIVPTERVDELLELLTARRADEVSARQFDPSGVTVTLYGFNEAPLDTVRLALDRDSGRLILDNGDFLARIFPADTAVPLWPMDYGIGVVEGVQARP